MDMHQDPRLLRELIRLLERKLGLIQDGEYTCCGITLAQCHALVEIGRTDGISLNRLAELLNLDNSTISRTVNNLVASELVRREIDPHDRRCVTIALTADGSSLYQGIETAMNLYYGKVFRAIPENKQGQVLESIQILLESIDSVMGCPTKEEESDGFGN